MARVAQHDVGQVHSSVGGVNRPFVTVADQVGQVAAVVYVGVRKQHGIQILDVEMKMPVALEGFLSAALEQAAFQQDLLPLISSKCSEPVTVRAAP
jgi:hypothetical protein